MSITGLSFSDCKDNLRIHQWKWIGLSNIVQEYHVKIQMSNVICHMSYVKCQMPNVNKVKLLPEPTSGAPPVIFVIKCRLFFWLFDSLLGTHIHGKCPHNKSGFIFIINCSPRMVSLVFSFSDLLDALVNISYHAIASRFFLRKSGHIYLYLGEDFTSMKALVVQSDGF